MGGSMDNSLCHLRSLEMDYVVCRNCMSVCSLFFKCTTIIMMLILMFVDETEAITYKIPLGYYRSVGFLKSKRSIPAKTRVNNLRGEMELGYYIAVDVGTPPQRMNVLIDTGSSNFAIATSANPFVGNFFLTNESTTFRETSKEVNVLYTEGKWSGLLASDVVSVPSFDELSVRAYLACISKSENFFINGSNWHGILGLAYPSLARPDSSVTQFFDALVGVRHVSNVFSLQLCGNSNDLNLLSGTMIIGGIDPSLFVGQITYAPLVREWFYEILLAGIQVGDIPVQIDCTELNADKTIVDSGTTNLRFPKKVFDIVIDMLKRQVSTHDITIHDNFWNGESLMCWFDGFFSIKDVFPRLKISVVHSWNTTFVLSIPPQQYLHEFQTLDSNFKSGDCYKLAISPSDTGTVLGTVVMEGFYLIFDRQNKRIGFAQSSCSDSDLSERSIILGPFLSSDPMKCSYVPPNMTESRMQLYASYIMAGLCAFGLIMLAIMIIRWMIAIRRRSSDETADANNLFNRDFN